MFSPKDVNHDFISKIVANYEVRTKIIYYLDNYFLDAHIAKIPNSVGKITERIKRALVFEDEEIINNGLGDGSSRGEGTKSKSKNKNNGMS